MSPRRHFDKPEERRHSTSSSFVAQYSSLCQGDCGDRIEPGEEVSYVDDALMHIDCQPRHWPDEDQPVCPHCWLQHKGECL